MKMIRSARKADPLKELPVPANASATHFHLLDGRREGCTHDRSEALFLDWHVLELDSCRKIEADKMLVPEVPGIYAVMDCETSVLFYVGKAMGYFKERPEGLRDRIFKEHLKPRARGSTLRKYVAAELGIPVFRDQSNQILSMEPTKFTSRGSSATEHSFHSPHFPGRRCLAPRKRLGGKVKPKWNPR